MPPAGRVLLEDQLRRADLDHWALLIRSTLVFPSHASAASHRLTGKVRLKPGVLSLMSRTSQPGLGPELS